MQDFYFIRNGGLTCCLSLTQTWPRLCLGNCSVEWVHNLLQLGLNLKLESHWLSPQCSSSLFLWLFSLQFAEPFEVLTCLFHCSCSAFSQRANNSWKRTQLSLLIDPRHKAETHSLFANDALLSLERNGCFESTIVSSQRFAWCLFLAVPCLFLYFLFISYFCKALSNSSKQEKVQVAEV